jgi:ferritin-like protein
MLSNGFSHNVVCKHILSTEKNMDPTRFKELERKLKELDGDSDSDSDSMVVCSSCAYAYHSAQIEDGLCNDCTNDPEPMELWCETCDQYHNH